MMYSDLILLPMENNRFRVLNRLLYKDIEVPKFYVTNGADIPRLGWIFCPPNKSDWLPAIVIHDYMCEVAERYEDYKKADRYFKEVLELLRVKPMQIWCLVNGVRLYHKVRYGINFKRRKNGVK